MKKKINFNEYEVVDHLDDDEKKTWDDLANDKYKSVLTDDIKKYYVQIFKDSAKRSIN